MKKKGDNKGLLYSILIIFCVVGVLYTLNYYIQRRMQKEVTYSTFKKYVVENKLSTVRISDQKIVASLKKPDKDISIIYTGYLNDTNLLPLLDKYHVAYGSSVEVQSYAGLLFKIYILPMIILGVIFYALSKALMSSAGIKGSGIGGFGKSNAKLAEKSKITFKDVAGEDEAKESLQELVDILKNPKRYKDIGAKIPKGCLLVGPPGTGKTLLAKALAGEADVPFYSVAASSFVEIYVGQGAAKVRDMFKNAREKAPCIVFIDELDAVGGKRGGVASGGNSEREQTLNQLLTEMDGFNSDKTIIVLAATNRPETLDKALLRPGRFDRQVIVNSPDLKGREDILKVHSKGKKLSEDVSLHDIALATAGSSGADLENIMNEGALLAVKKNQTEIHQCDLQEAIEVVIAGKAKKNKILSDKEKHIVACHEVGHALVAGLLKNVDPVQKISIIPRTNGALGYTMQTPENQKFLLTREDLVNKIKIFLGGRCAEELMQGEYTTGASNDLERANAIARQMITVYGMGGENIPKNVVYENPQNQYLDGSYQRVCSDATYAKVDAEVSLLINKVYSEVSDLLINNKDCLEDVTKVLLEKEVLTGAEFKSMLKKYGIDLADSKATV